MQSAEHHSGTTLRSRHTQTVVERRRQTEGGNQAISSGKTDDRKKTKRIRSYSQQTSRHLRIIQRANIYILWIGVCLMGVLLLRWSGGRKIWYIFGRRQNTRVVVWNDHPAETESYFRLPVTSFTRKLSVVPSIKEPDFGGLIFEPREGKEILVSPTDYDLAELQRDESLDRIDGRIEDEFLPESSKVDRDIKCHLPIYAAYSFPTCNSLHELRMQNHQDEGLEVSYLNHGFYRDAFRYQRQSPSNSDHFVMKKMRLKRAMGAAAVAKVHKESIILERLTSSPRVLDIYSHCGSTVLVEAMASDINDQIVPPTGYMRQSKLDELQEDDVHPLNNFTVSEKLQIALDMAESLADIHGFEGGLIVHADVHLDQWLLAPDGSVKLNDFGDSYPAPWDRKRKKYCFRRDLSRSGTWRSPEEYIGGLQDEAIDVYVFGNNIYTLLTGLWPFYHEEYTNVDYGFIRMLMSEGTRPFVDARYRSRSFIETKLIEIMEQCWTPKDKRVSIFDVVTSLRFLKQRAATMGMLETSDVIKIVLPPTTVVARDNDYS